MRDLTSQCAELKKENNELKRDLDLLKAVVSKQCSEISHLRHDLLDQQDRQMRNNVLFHQIPEERNENCEQKVRDLLSKSGYTDHAGVAIDRIHRIGKYDSKSQYPRPVVAKVSSSSQVDSLLKFGQAKKDEIKITPQFPTELRARRKQLAEIAEAARNKGENVKTKIVLDTLYINGERYGDALPRPSAREVLFMSETEKKEATRTKFSELSKQVDGSTFIVRAAKVQTINDCRANYRILLSDPENMTATHNTAIYRLYSPEGAVTSDGYTDDGEHGMGKTVQDTLQQLDAKNVVVFVTRHYGGKHLGQKRFDTVKELVKALIPKLGDK